MGKTSNICKDFTSPNFDKRKKKIDSIVIHSTHLPRGKWIKEVCDKSVKLSAHYLIDLKGKIYQLVEDKDRAWHAGISHWRGKNSLNENSIGIELVDRTDKGEMIKTFPKPQMNSLIDLLKLLIKKYKIPNHNIVAHSDIAPGRKDDPGENFDWALLASNKIGQYHKIKTNKEDKACFLDPNNTTITKLKEIQRMLKAQGYKIKITGKYDIQTKHVVTGFRRHFNPTHLEITYLTMADFKILSNL
jgi:N-acetylmuramoyl-L-alanine amidase